MVNFDRLDVWAVIFRQGVANIFEATGIQDFSFEVAVLHPTRKLFGTGAVGIYHHW